MKFKYKKIVYCAVLSVILLLLFIFNVLERFELQAQDALYRSPGLIDPNIFVFGIDEETLIEFGPFQFWSRQIMADAISILNSDPGWEPAVIAVDVLYSGYSNCPESDAALADAAAEIGNVIFGAAASFNWAGEVTTFERPFASLERVSGYGALNSFVDPDGVVRRALTGIDAHGVMEPTFPVVIYEMFTGGKLTLPDNISDPLYLTFSGEIGDYYGALGLGTSFKDIFAEDFDPGFYADAIILIGPYAAGMMDSYFTAADPRHQMHGVEIHANILQMLLEQNYRAYAGFGLNLAAVIGVLIIFGVVSMKSDVRISFAALIVFAAGYIFLNRWLFDGGLIMTLIYPPLSAAVIFAFAVAYNYITVRIEKKKIKDMFSKYVDPKLVNELITSDLADFRVGRKKHFAVLFVDIRGFTPMSERLKDEPETVVHILNDYLELTASCVFNNGGSVDKFIGDATMALFNGFTPLEDYTYRAVKAAFDIVNGAKALNDQILEKYGFTVGFGVGVHCGYAVVGNIGPQYRKDYTAIGDTVNTAARLESNAQASQVLLTQEVLDMVGDGRIAADSLGEITMKGKGAIEVFALTGVN
jgi:adenylate cyclase